MSNEKASRSLRIEAQILCYRRNRFGRGTARDHRVYKLPLEVPVRRGAVRAKTVEKDQVREVPAGLRNLQSRLRLQAERQAGRRIDGYAERTAQTRAATARAG